ncbi:MAG: hypothetical protein RSF90_02780, partial [Pygmaiobacter sp.]
MKQHKKTGCFSIQCYNEKDNVVSMAESLLGLFVGERAVYEGTIQFIANCSTDGACGLVRALRAQYPNVQAIIYARDFPMTSSYWEIINEPS